MISTSGIDYSTGRSALRSPREAYKQSRHGCAIMGQRRRPPVSTEHSQRAPQSSKLLAESRPASGNPGLSQHTADAGASAFALEASHHFG